MRRLAAALALSLAAAGATAYAAPSISDQAEDAVALRVEARDHLTKEIRPALATPGVPAERVSDLKCTDGFAGPFPCDGVDLLSFVPLEEFLQQGPEDVAPLGGGASDLWGWTDPLNDDEYVLMGKTNGTAIFRVTDPEEPVYLGEIPNSSPGQLVWHDIKVYRDHAFIVSESAGHGMRVFDLTRLRGVTTPQTFTEDVNYPLGFSAHNIAINTETGYAYIVGGNNGLVAPDQCRSGLHMVDISNPKVPLFVGCHAIGEGKGTAGGVVGAELAAYIHDTQCVVYRGPDAEHRGKELCFNSSEDHLSIVDVTDKLAPVQISKTPYENVRYAHQGWLVDGQSTFLLGDELDEGRGGEKLTRTLVFDVSDLEAPKAEPSFSGRSAAIDHNMYERDGLVYQSNYAAGLAVVATGKDTGEDTSGLEQVAFFDSIPHHDRPEFVGTWSNYPYFESGTIAMSSIDEGLFLLKVQPQVLRDHARPAQFPPLPPQAQARLQR